MRLKLTDLELAEAVSSLPGWKIEGEMLERTYTFRSFRDTVEFVQDVAEAADAADHHPDLDIRYTKLRVALSTHDAGGVTAADVGMARTIDGLARPARAT